MQKAEAGVRGLIGGALAVLALAVVTSACGDDPVVTPPTTPTPTTTTETFSGTVNRNGAVTHSFSSQASGTVTATLTTVAPDSALIIGLSLGTWNGAVCQIVLANDVATQGTTVTGGVSSFGSLCVRVYDVGNISATQPVSYELTVVHP
jgi:hypothetical protein